MTVQGDATDVNGVLPSLKRTSSFRLVSDGLVMAAGMTVSILTARLLGPAGKGSFAALLFVSGLAAQLVSFGLGDAAVILLGKRRWSLQETLSNTLAISGVAALIASAAFLVAARLLLPALWEADQRVVLVMMLLVPASLFQQVFAQVLNSQERVVATSVLIALSSITTAVGVWVLVDLLSAGIEGAAWAVLLPSLASALATLVLLRRTPLSLIPRWDSKYLRHALRYGPIIQMSSLMVLLTGRADLIVVYRLMDDAAAGRYSVALTIGALVGTAAVATSYAAFPRLAHLPETEAIALALRISRVSLAAATVTALVLTPIAWFGIPLVFGGDFSTAVPPTLILLGSGLISTPHWVISRAAAARGEPLVLFLSFAATVALMILLDFVFIPALGLNGASTAAVIAGLGGLVVCLRLFKKRVDPTLAFSEAFPRGPDFAELFQLVSSLKRKVSSRRAGGTPGTGDTG